jgi:hypothetical protein
MSPWKTASRLVGAVLCTLAFAATAPADPGNGNGDENGNGVGIGIGGTPPGHQENNESPAASAQPPAQAPAAAAAAAVTAKQTKQANKEARKEARKDERQAVKVEKRPPKSQSQGAARKASKEEQTRDDATPTSSRGRSAEAHHHVIVCHRTGSESNPYVVINIPLTAWQAGHSRHGDILLKDPASRPGSKDGLTKENCESPAGTTAQATPPVTATSGPTGGCPPPATPERSVIGVWHATGAYKNGQRKYVFITPNQASAHYSKHADDIPVYGAPAGTSSQSSQNCAAQETQHSTPVVAASAQQQQSGDVVWATPAAMAAAGAPASVRKGTAVPQQQAGGVAGRVAHGGKSEPQAKRAGGGVLGAVASAPAAVARVASGTLPFTGIPLWIAVLMSGGLLVAGLTLRRIN